MSKSQFNLNKSHRFFCIVTICNFLVFIGAIIPNHFHNAIYSSIKHDYYPFTVGFISNFWTIRSSSTWGTISSPYTLSNVIVFWKIHLTCFYVRYVFQTPFEFLFPILVWTCNNSEVTLLSDIKHRLVFPDVIIFSLGILPHHMPKPNVLMQQSLA